MVGLGPKGFWSWVCLAGAGINLRKRRLRVVKRPDPKTLKAYWSYFETLTTVPTLLKSFTWMIFVLLLHEHMIPQESRRKGRVVLLIRVSLLRHARKRRASFLALQVSCQEAYAEYNDSKTFQAYSQKKASCNL